MIDPGLSLPGHRAAKWRDEPFDDQAFSEEEQPHCINLLLFEFAFAWLQRKIRLLSFPR
jgi:hypothetical protein